MRVERRAYAKVNLALAVGGPLPPGHPNAGMHPIASWMHTVELWDDVAVETLAAGPSRYDIRWAPDAPRGGAIDWPPEKDLGVRAHRLMESLANRSLPLALQTLKRIPAGGGLGGGSSDAAAVMLAVNDAFGLGFSLDRLAAASRVLGSDIAFFLDGSNPPRPAVVGGLGDQIERTERINAVAVLVVPPFGCATGAVYRAFDELSPGTFAAERVRAMALSGDTGELFNDLTEAARRAEPRMAPFLSRLSALGPAAMSGSGSTVFVLTDGASAPGTWAKIRAALPDATVAAVRLV